MKKRLTWVATLAVSCALLVSCGTTTTPAPKPAASATPPTPAQPRTQTRVTSGTVASVEGSTVTITTAQGQVTANIGPNTSIQKTVPGTLADLQEGQSLTVSGPQNADGIIVATSIAIRPESRGLSRTPPAGATPRPRTRPATPSGGAPTITNGTISKIVSNTLTLTTTQGQVIVNVGSNTYIQKTETGTLSDLQEGESLAIVGARDASGNIAATSIVIRPPRQGSPPGP